MPLTDTKVRAAKAADKPYKLTDRDGLHLLVTPKGFKSWRVRYARGGKETLVTLGAYTDGMSLRDARDRATELLRGVRNAGPVMPAVPTGTLADVAYRWHRINSSQWKRSHAATIISGLEREIFPTLGAVDIRELTAPQVLQALRAVEARGSFEGAHRLRCQLANVFAFGIGEGVCDGNPAEAIKRAMAPKPASEHRPAVTTLDEARRVLRAAEATPAHALTRLALRLLALTAQRPGEVVGMRWCELLGFSDVWSAPLWNIPAERMKGGRRGHSVPLSTQAVDVLRAAQRLSGRGDLVFPSPAVSGIEKALSLHGLRDLLERAGLAGIQVPHGWRATFSTVMNGEFPQDRMVIDLMLSHVSKGAVEGAYNRQAHMERRRELAQLWADMLLEGAPEAVELLELPRQAVLEVVS